MKLGVSYFGNRIPRHYRDRDLPEIVAAGCSYVVHTFSEEDLRFYRSAVGDMVAHTHSAGLEAHLDPWGVGGVFGGEAFSDFLLHHRDDWQVRADGAAVPIACLRSQRFQAFVRTWVDAAVDLGADVLFWDEPHLAVPTADSPPPGSLTCWCDVCQDAYRAEHGEPMPAELTPTLVAFRDDSVVRFLAAMCEYAAAKGVRNTVCLHPFVDPVRGLTDWSKVARIPAVETIGVTAFWHLWGHDASDFVGRWARTLTALCREWGKEPQVWLQGFLIDAGLEREVATAADAAADAGVRDLAVWGFQGCAHMSAIASPRPAHVWRTVVDAYRRLGGRA